MLDRIKAGLWRVGMGLVALWLKFAEGADLAEETKRLRAQVRDCIEANRVLREENDRQWNQLQRMRNYLNGIGHGVPE